MPLTDAPPRYLLDRVVHVDSQTQSSSLTSGTQSQTLKMRVGFAAEWLSGALAYLQDLADLAPGWDGYEAKAVEADEAMRAVTFLAEVAAAMPNIARPSIVPLSDGGVQVEWHRGGVDFEVAYSDAEPGVYLVDHTSNKRREMPLREAKDEILRLASRLAA